jgi:hypothetical protein
MEDLLSRLFLMRRLVIEGSITDMMDVVPFPELLSIKSFEILYFLEQGPTETSLIARIEFTEPQVNRQDFFAGFQEAQLLDRDKDGVGIYYLKKKPMEGDLLGTGGFMVPPFAIHGDTMKLAFVGSVEQVDQFLAAIESKSISFKIVSITDARFALDSPLNALTEKQRDALIAAFNAGYFDVPRRVTSEQLASALHIHHSSLNMRLRKAELHLLSRLLKG